MRWFQKGWEEHHCQGGFSALPASPIQEGEAGHTRLACTEFNFRMMLLRLTALVQTDTGCVRSENGVWTYTCKRQGKQQASAEVVKDLTNSCLPETMLLPLSRRVWVWAYWTGKRSHLISIRHATAPIVLLKFNLEQKASLWPGMIFCCTNFVIGGSQTDTQPSLQRSWKWTRDSRSVPMSLGWNTSCHGQGLHDAFIHLKAQNPSHVKSLISGKRT